MEHRPNRTASVLSLCACAMSVILAIGYTSARAQTTVVLGADGQVAWDVGDGSIAQVADLTIPTVIFDTESGFEVDETNSPGGVIEFNPLGFSIQFFLDP